LALAAAFTLRVAVAIPAVKAKAKEKFPKPTCPGQFSVAGFDKPVSIVPTGWTAPYGAEEVEVLNGTEIRPHMNSRSYFASSCTPGKYNSTEYTRMPLLGKTLRYTLDLGGAGCGCNAAFYLTSMGHNTHESECFDYYCDANNVCGQTCAEIDIQEANQHAFHATLHGANDSFGTAAGEGGGGPGWNGPRDWDENDYGPGGKCIDSKAPYEVAVSFPTDEATGSLKAMWVSLSQVAKKGEPCRISLDISSYDYMSEMTQELKRGMTPIVSYWADDDMLWLDGLGDDHQGQCSKDIKKKCSDSVKFYNFSIADISDEDSPVPPKKPTTRQPVSDAGGWNWEASDSTTSSKEAWQQPAWEQPAWEQPASSTAQAVGSLGWDSGEGGGDGQSSDPTAADRGKVVEGGKCVEFANWRKAAVGGRAVQMNLGKAAYGAQTTWKECRSLCANDKDCKQVVFYKPSGSCFGTREAQGDDQDRMGGSNYDFVSAHCNNACAEFNNWRKTETGEEIPLGKHKYGDVAEDWPTCRDRCAAEEKCQQVVYYRPERKCFGMSERGDDDEDSMGGNNPNFVSAHCQKTGADADGEEGSSLDELDSTRGDHILMQKKHARLPGPGWWAADDTRWAMAGAGLVAIAVLVACGVVAVGAKRRRNLRAAPLEGLRRIASLAEVRVADAGHGLMRTKPSSERLLEVGAAALAPPPLPGGRAVEMQQRYL